MGITVKSSQIDEVINEKMCSVVVTTTAGIDVTMYGEIKNNKARMESIAPSHWNSDLFNQLNESIQTEIIQVVAIELKKLQNENTI